MRNPSRNTAPENHHRRHARSPTRPDPHNPGFRIMGTAPGMDGGQVVVPGVAVPDQHTGEIGEDATVVDVVAAAAADVQQCQVLGAGHVDVGQGAGGASGGFVGVQHRRGGQQVLHVRQERRGEFLRGAAPGPGGESGCQVQTGQCFQQGGGPSDGQVVPAGQQRAHGQCAGPDPHR